MFFEMTADNVDEYIDDDFTDGAVDADILVEGSVVGEVTLLIDGNGLTTWGGDIRMWASEDLLTFLWDAEDEDDNFGMSDQISEIIGAVEEAWKKG